MPAPHQCTLPTPCDRGSGPIRRCRLCRGNVHGGVVQVRAGSRVVVRWERTAQKSESPPMPNHEHQETKDVLALNEGAIAHRSRPPDFLP